MDTHTLTLALGGPVEIGQFQEGITRFQKLVSALTPRAGVKWVVADLQYGSAAITLAAETEVAADAAKAKQVVADFDNIGKALESHAPLAYNRRAQQAVAGLQVLAHTMEYVRLETPSGDYIVPGQNGVAPSRGVRISIGAITGRVQTLTNRGGLRFKLYDHIHDKAVACYLQSGQEELMRAAWGRRARVSGTVSRDGKLGLPVAVRQILKVEILEEPKPGAYRAARGAIPWQPGYETPEAVIRRLRDGWLSDG